MKYIGPIYLLFRGLSNPDSFFGMIVGLFIWLIATAIETAIISAIIAFIGKVGFDKEFEDVFQRSFIIVGIIEIILGLFYICS